MIVNEIENKFTFGALHGIVVIGNFAKRLKMVYTPVLNKLVNQAFKAKEIER